MNLAENLLNSLPNTTYTATETASVVEEPHIVIDETRKITIPDALKKIAVTGDENVETVTFDCVRYWDENDLSSFAIYLNYVLPSGISGTYIPTSIRRATEYYSFDWNIGRPITDDSGQIEISLIAIKTDENGILQKQWGSFTNKDLTVVRGLQLQNVPEIEQETDILSQILGGLNEKVSKYDVVQTTGYSETAVMSQKAVTGCVATLDARISANSDRISANSDRISANSDRLTNIEAGLPSSVWHVDDTVARVKDVPENARPYAMISEIGGMTRKCTNILPSLIRYAWGCECSVEADGKISFTRVGSGGVAFIETQATYLNANQTYFVHTGGQNLRNGFIAKDGYDPDENGIIYGERSYTPTESGYYYIRLYMKDESVDGDKGYAYIWINTVESLPYEPYFEGLRDAKVTAVESVGVNLIPFPYTDSSKKINGVSFTVNADRSITISGTATDTVVFTLSNNIYLGDEDMSTLWVSSATNGKYYLNVKHVYYHAPSLNLSIRITTGAIVNETIYPMASIDRILDYVPYFKNTFPIPEAVQALEGYGQGISKEYHNKIVLDPASGVKKFVKQIGEIDLGTLEWGISYDYFISAYVPNRKQGLYNITVEGGEIAPTYNGAFNDSFPHGTWGGAANAPIITYKMHPNEYADAIAFKNAMTGKRLIYELSTPVETDISVYFGDDNLIGVEGGGTMTFENEHGYDMPNTVTYMLKEVSA